MDASPLAIMFGSVPVQLFYLMLKLGMGTSSAQGVWQQDSFLLIRSLVASPQNQSKSDVDGLPDLQLCQCEANKALCRKKFVFRKLRDLPV